MVRKKFAMNMAQAKARIWPCMAYSFQVRSTADGRTRQRDFPQPPTLNPESQTIVSSAPLSWRCLALPNFQLNVTIAQKSKIHPPEKSTIHPLESQHFAHSKSQHSTHSKSKKSTHSTGQQPTLSKSQQFNLSKSQQYTHSRLAEAPPPLPRGPTPQNQALQRLRLARR